MCLTNLSIQTDPKGKNKERLIRLSSLFSNIVARNRIWKSGEHLQMQYQVQMLQKCKYRAYSLILVFRIEEISLGPTYTFKLTVSEQLAAIFRWSKIFSYKFILSWKANTQSRSRIPNNLEVLARYQDGWPGINSRPGKVYQNLDEVRWRVCAI